MAKYIEYQENEGDDMLQQACNCGECGQENYDEKEYIQEGGLEPELVQIEQFKTFPTIPLDTEDVEGIPLDLDRFSQGVEEASKIAGVITTLKTVGCSEEFILQYVLNKETIKHNLESLKLTNEGGLEIARVQADKVENSTL